ncbi:MAG: threonylcarbamoyl-AMP synthase [Candidatus Hydrogenedentes bacterium]|nr:threonylcarbamoyl-AMP synthase [Candidatus Hydrogenedentota bacterium]
MKILPASDAGIREAVAALRRGAVVGYPTETVYGLAVDPFSERALEALYRVKGRDPRQPVLLIVADESQLGSLTSEVSPEARRLIQAFWPGSLSLLLPPAAEVPATLLGPEGKVCVRCPGAPIARALCAAFSGPLTSTSANLSGAPAARTARAALLPGVALVLDGGTLPESAPSTVVDPDSGEVLREGATPVTALAALYPGLRAKKKS